MRAVASTDLMEQVRALAEDKGVHPAAPIVLAGAALEIALRSAVDELHLTLAERPSLTAYARRLRKEGVLSAQDMKDVEQMAGVRNSAAHGNFDELNPARAGLMEQQVNFFLARLTNALEPAKGDLPPSNPATP
jgi:ParB-like chromosome segregation protein Spo0J